MACVPRGQMVLVNQTVSEAIVYPVFVGTNRPLDQNNYVTRGRSEALTLQRFDVSVPPERETGRIQWPKDGGDPATEFVTTKALQYNSESGFLSAVRQELRKMPKGNREIVVFVHGFNTTLAEAVYRLAQMDHDLELQAVPVLFAWPSAEDPFGYVHDRDSALYSRDDLEALLRLLNKAGADEIVILTHSMGSFLAAETMRQMDKHDPGSLPGMIDGVVMMSPDIDEDLALNQLSEITELPQPFVVFSSDEDQALRLASRVAGDNPRLGRGADVARFADIEITFLDVSAFADGADRNFGHLPVANSEALIELLPELRRVAASLDYNLGNDPGFIPGTVLNIQRATEVVLEPIERLTP
ncbi:MAG: alpha/beta fold hydrolase [Mangrovicoccus sp.]|nr:alpha/beta fold hydrolase [Mangrovicoccus sp.]